MIEPRYSVEQEDGTGGDFPGWYVRRTMPVPVKAPAGGGVSIAGPFDSKARAERWLRLRSADGSLARMLPIPPAALMRRDAGVVRSLEALPPDRPGERVPAARPLAALITKEHNP